MAPATTNRNALRTAFRKVDLAHIRLAYALREQEINDGRTSPEELAENVRFAEAEVNATMAHLASL